jgi:hypothetical protein
MSGLGETKLGFGSLIPTAIRLPRVSSDFHSGSGVGAGAGASVGAAVGVGVACARGVAGSSLLPHPETASARAPAAMAMLRERIGLAAGGGRVGTVLDG